MSAPSGDQKITRLSYDEHYDKGIRALEMGSTDVALAHGVLGLLRLLSIPERHRQF